jgi:hypothetical protein
MDLFFSNDLWVVDVEGGMPSLVLPPGEGGKFTFSADGQTIALTTPGQIDLVDVGGASRRSVFSHTPDSSDGDYYAAPVWAADSQSLRVAVPSADRGAASIWHISTGGQPARLLGEVTTVPGMQTAPLFSPDLEQIATLTALPAQDDAAGNLPAIAVSGLGEDGVEEPILYPAEAIALRAWSPDSVRLLYQSPAAAVAEITIGQFETRDLLSSDDRHRIGRLQWVHKFRFLFIDYVGDGWQISLADVSGREPLLIDSGDRFPAAFDATWVPVSSGH